MTAGPPPYERARIYLRPFGIVAGADAASCLEQGHALPLAGGPLAFTQLEAVVRDGPRSWRSRLVPVVDRQHYFSALDPALRRAADDLMECLTAARPDMTLRGGRQLTWRHPLIMGIVNVTPDSFSDGGRFHDPALAVAHATALHEEGADLLDIGGESTRPGAEPVSMAEEQARILPVIRATAALGPALSVDTRHAATMAAAVDAGAALINDVSALSHDPQAAATAARLGVPVVLMHAQGDPRTMQANPSYDHVVLDVFDALERYLADAAAAGISRDRLIVDPGIGFGKSTAHNMALIRNLSLFHGLGCPLLLGVSRKSFTARLNRGEAPQDRLGGSLGAALAGAAQGVQIVRVHDVAATRQALVCCGYWGSMADPSLS